VCKKWCEKEVVLEASTKTGGWGHNEKEKKEHKRRNGSKGNEREPEGLHSVGGEAHQT